MPMRDRLEEMQQQSELLKKGQSKTGKESSKMKVNGDKTLQNFLAEVSKIESELAKLKTDVVGIKKLQLDILSKWPDDNNKVTKCNALAEKFRLDATKIGTSLKELEKKYDSEKIQSGSAFERVRTQQLSTLTAELNISTNEFFKVQSEYMNKVKEIIRKHRSARGDSITDDTKVNEILDQDSCSIFTDNYIADVYDAQQTLRDLDDRKKDILALENSVTEVNILFKEIGLLVTAQGEKVTSIKGAVDATTAFIESGNKELDKANEYRKRARRKKCFIIIIVLIVLVIVGIILAIIFTSK